MELTSKQRAQLRSIANSIDTIVIIGIKIRTGSFESRS